jgi:hypothetical protein
MNKNIIVLTEAVNAKNKDINELIIKMLNSDTKTAKSLIKNKDLPLRIDIADSDYDSQVITHAENGNQLYIEFNNGWQRDRARDTLLYGGDIMPLLSGARVYLNGRALDRDSRNVNPASVDYWGLLTEHDNTRDYPTVEIGGISPSGRTQSVQNYLDLKEDADDMRVRPESHQATLRMARIRAVLNLNQDIIKVLRNLIVVALAEDASSDIVNRKKRETGSKLPVREYRAKIDTSSIDDLGFRHIFLREKTTQYSVIIIDYSSFMLSPYYGITVLWEDDVEVTNFFESKLGILGLLDKMYRDNTISTNTLTALAKFVNGK